eukprot:SM000060S19651  [mRNA]  locus=s60:310061:311092:- [translate_table: standard]
METSLKLDSTTRRLGFLVKEKFVTDNNLALTCSGFLAADDGAARGDVQLVKNFFPGWLTRFDVGARYGTEFGELSYGVSGKKTFELNDEGLLSIDVKGKYQYGQRKREHALKGSVEISQKVFNITEGQDLKMTLGFDLIKRHAYAQIRENNWTLNSDFAGNWSVLYDL